LLLPSSKFYWIIYGTAKDLCIFLFVIQKFTSFTTFILLLKKRVKRVILKMKVLDLVRRMSISKFLIFIKRTVDRKIAFSKVVNEINLMICNTVKNLSIRFWNSIGFNLQKIRSWHSFGSFKSNPRIQYKYFNSSKPNQSS
jgi:hypothetical protein